MCPHQRAVLLYLQASAIQIRLVIDPFVYSPPVLSQAYGGICKNRSGPSLEFSMIDCNSGHLCYANTLFYQQLADLLVHQARRVCA